MPATLRGDLDAALDGLPFQPGLFAPFVAAVGKARSGPPISRADLDGTSLSLKLELAVVATGRWLGCHACPCAVSPRPMPSRGRSQANRTRFWSICRAESDRLLRVYLREGVSLACLGAAAIGLLLAVSLRSLPRLDCRHRTARRCGRGHIGGSAPGRTRVVDLQPVRRAPGGRHRLELLPVLRPPARRSGWEFPRLRRTVRVQRPLLRFSRPARSAEIPTTFSTAFPSSSGATRWAAAR